MGIGARLGRWRWVLLAASLVVLLAVASGFVTLPLRDSDKAAAARTLVAWIVEGRPVPGFGEQYTDAQWMPRQQRFVVICDFVPPEVSLSDDQRVQRITVQEQGAIFKKHRFDATDYMVIKLELESRSELILEFSNAFGHWAPHGYRFEFRRKVWGLRSSATFLWVS